MKRILCFLCVALLISLSGCKEDSVINSIGESSEIGFYSNEGFQDYTDYAKYSYETVDFENNAYFKNIDGQLKSEFEKHLDDFEEWIGLYKENGSEYDIVKYYDFDKSIISDEDYIYIYDDPDYPEMGCYDVYFFDFESKILYYFHNNI